MKSIKKIEPVSVGISKAKTRVAAYCRVSTDMDEQLGSLETQKSHYEEFINANPAWTFAGIYYDEGISGTSKEKRPALMQMVADCEAGKIDRILTKSLSRFARNTTDCIELVRKLLDLGVTIYFEKENLDTGTMESELMLSIMSSLAESESISNSENNKWGVRHRFQNGTFKISYPPFGYDTQDGMLVINEAEAEWVKWIFGQVMHGMTSGKIAKLLNEKKVPTKRGGTWTEGTIRGMLRNEKYIGDCLCQKTFTDFQFKRHRNYGSVDKFYLEDHHEAIISRETFKAAGALLEQRALERKIKKNDPRYRNRYPFSGRLICGECGSKLKRCICSTGTYKYASWACRGHTEDLSSCSMKAVRECDLEPAFTTMMNKLIFARKEVLEALRCSIREEAGKKKDRRIIGIDQKLEQNAERRQTLNMLMTKGYIDPAVFTQESNELTAEADALKRKKERLEDETIGKTCRAKALDELISFTGHAEPSSAFDGDLVKKFLDNATICAEGEVIFHLKCGLDLKERIRKK